MWDLNILFWLILGVLCIGTIGYRLPETIKKAKKGDPKKKNQVFVNDLATQILLAILGFFCLITSNIKAYDYGIRKIMTPGDLNQEIHKVEQQMKIPGHGAVVAAIDGKKACYLVMNHSLLDPEVSHVKKHQKIDGKWELRSTDYVDPIEDYEKRNAELKKAREENYPKEPNAQ